MICFNVSGQEPYAVVQPKPLEVVGDSVKFSVEIFVPKDKVMKKEGTYVIMPELGEHKFPKIKIPSSQLGDAANMGITVNITSSIPFKEEMIANYLEIEHEYEYKDGAKNEEFKDMDDLSTCCITTGMLFIMNSQYQVKRTEYIPGKDVPLKWVGQINFPVDISKFEGKEYQNELRQMGEYLKMYPEATIRIRGFASPEGPYERNKTLAKERAQQAEAWLTGQLKDLGYGRYVKKANINVETTTEDWNGFVQTLKRSDLSKEKQNEVKQLVSAGHPPKETEQKIMEVVGGEQGVEQYLAPLRRTTIVVQSKDAKRRGYSAAQIDSILTAYNSGNISTTALKDVFNQEEYLQASQANDQPSGKLVMLAAYYESYPDDKRVYSDLATMNMVDVSQLDAIGGDDALVGVGFNRDNYDVDSDFDIDDDKVKIKYSYESEDDRDVEIDIKYKNDIEDNEEMLKIAYEADENDFVAANNLGAMYLAENNPDMAYIYLTKANQVQVNTGNSYNMGLYHARKGEYDKAIQHFNKVSDDVPGLEYNRGLAKLMHGDTQGAMADLGTFTSEHPDVAIGHYIMAVAAARANDLQTLTTHLKQAIKLNKDLSDIAQEDLEFRQYEDNEIFELASDDDPEN